MSKTYAHYTESTKRNVVAAVRSGLSIRGLGKRLSIPETIRMIMEAAGVL